MRMGFKKVLNNSARGFSKEREFNDCMNTLLLRDTLCTKSGWLPVQIGRTRYNSKRNLKSWEGFQWTWKGKSSDHCVDQAGTFQLLPLACHARGRNIWGVILSLKDSWKRTNNLSLNVTQVPILHSEDYYTQSSRWPDTRDRFHIRP